MAGADDLKISPFRPDGVTYGTPIWIWNVAVDDERFLRADNGWQSRWYQAALAQRAGQVGNDQNGSMFKRVRIESIREPYVSPVHVNKQSRFFCCLHSPDVIPIDK